jgi:predicted thioredoxin/glutaredoxin
MRAARESPDIEQCVEGSVRTMQVDVNNVTELFLATFLHRRFVSPAAVIQITTSSSLSQK